MYIKRLLVCALAAALLPAEAEAATSYLKCVISDSTNGDFVMDVQLNEEGSTVSYSFPDNGRSYRMSAIFSPDAVSFGNFTISRTDLSIVRKNDGQFDQTVFHMPAVNRGTCTKDDRQRAF